MSECEEFAVAGENFLTLQFEVGASNEKSGLWRSVNVACADCSRVNPGAAMEHLGKQLVHT